MQNLTTKNVAKLELTIENPVEDEQYVVLLLSGGDEIPTSDNIRYINQDDGASFKAGFVLYPDTMKIGGMYSVIIASATTGKDTVASFNVTVPEPDFTIGDADGSGSFDIGDIVCVLRYLAYGEELNQQAADADGSDGVDIGDVVKMLRVLADYETF